jgi:hypothetical protein
VVSDQLVCEMCLSNTFEKQDPEICLLLKSEEDTHSLNDEVK